MSDLNNFEANKDERKAQAREAPWSRAETREIRTLEVASVTSGSTPYIDIVLIVGTRLPKLQDDY